jgi:hypothetical protein
VVVDLHTVFMHTAGVRQTVASYCGGRVLVGG